MSHASRKEQLQRVLRPRHVAVIGGDAAEEAARQLDGIGFTGEVWPVNPRRSAMAGRTCFSGVATLPEAPDAALVATPAEACPDVFAALNARGAGGGVCFAAGFREEGDDALQRALVDAAGDCALLGPNCHGILNYLDGVALWPDEHGGERVDAGVAVISQSGNIALNATFEQRGVPLACVIGTGNQAQLEIADFIDALLDDPRVSAIGLFIEGLDDAARFAAAATRALQQGVPLVALKVGASEAGSRASMSHTAVLTGSDAVFDALFESLGIVRARTLAEWLETLKLFAVNGPLAGPAVLSLSCSGGEAALMGDLLAAAGLTLPAPPAERVPALAEAFRIPPASVGNPLDYNTRIWGDAVACARGFEAALATGADTGVLLLDFPPSDDGTAGNWRAALDGYLAAAGRGNTPAVVLSTLPEALPDAARGACFAAGVAPLQGLAEGCRALGHASRYATLRGHLLARGGPWPGPAGGVSAGVQPGTALDESASKATLAARGLPVPQGEVCREEAVAEAAARIGYPVVIKALVPDLAHKSDAGAVAVNVAGAVAARSAVTGMRERLAHQGLHAERWLVEGMVTDAVAELIVGVKRDPLVGPVLVVGSGGVLAELMADVRTVLLPTSAAQVREALESTGAGQQMLGFRGGEAGDMAAAVTACLSVADYAVAEADRLVELDVNPLIVRPAGRGAVAADALIALGGDDADGTGPVTGAHRRSCPVSG